MELKFKDYVQEMQMPGPWGGAAAGAYIGGALGGPLGAVAGGALGYGAGKLFGTPTKGEPNPRHFTYFRGADGKMDRMVKPQFAHLYGGQHGQQAMHSDADYEAANMDPNSAYHYIKDPTTNKYHAYVKSDYTSRGIAAAAAAAKRIK